MCAPISELQSHLRTENPYVLEPDPELEQEQEQELWFCRASGCVPRGEGGQSTGGRFPLLVQSTG